VNAIATFHFYFHVFLSVLEHQPTDKAEKAAEKDPRDGNCPLNFLANGHNDDQDPSFLENGELNSSADAKQNIYSLLFVLFEEIVVHNRTIFLNKLRNMDH
jgi:hypothetical protein